MQIFLPELYKNIKIHCSSIYPQILFSDPHTLSDLDDWKLLYMASTMMPVLKIRPNYLAVFYNPAKRVKSSIPGTPMIFFHQLLCNDDILYLPIEAGIEYLF